MFSSSMSICHAKSYTNHSDKFFWHDKALFHHFIDIGTYDRLFCLRRKLVPMLSRNIIHCKSLVFTMYSILSFCGVLSCLRPPPLPGPTVAARADRCAVASDRAGSDAAAPGPIAAPGGPRPRLLGGHALTTGALDWEVMKCVFLPSIRFEFYYFIFNFLYGLDQINCIHLRQ